MEDAGANISICPGGTGEVDHHKPTQAERHVNCSFLILFCPRNKGAIENIPSRLFDLTFGAYPGPCATNDQLALVIGLNEYAYHIHGCYEWRGSWSVSMGLQAVVPFEYVQIELY